MDQGGCLSYRMRHSSFPLLLYRHSPRCQQQGFEDLHGRSSTTGRYGTLSSSFCVTTLDAGVSGPSKQGWGFTGRKCECRLFVAKNGSCSVGGVLKTRCRYRKSIADLEAIIETLNDPWHSTTSELY